MHLWFFIAFHTVIPDGESMYLYNNYLQFLMLVCSLLNKWSLRSCKLDKEGGTWQLNRLLQCTVDIEVYFVHYSVQLQNTVSSVKGGVLCSLRGPEYSK